MSTEFDDLFEQPAEPQAAATPFDDLFEQPQSTEFDDLFDQAPSRELPRAALSKAMQDAGVYGSFTSAAAPWFGSAPKLTWNEDGKPNLPLMHASKGGLVDSIGSMVVSLGNKLGAGMDMAGPAVDEEGVFGVFDKLVQSGYSREELSQGWDDLVKQVTKFEDTEPVRVMSDGALLPNYGSSDWLDDDKAKAIIESAPTDQRVKDNTLANLKQIQTEIAANKLAAYAAASAASPMEGPQEWADRNGRAKDFGSPAFVKDYEADVVAKAGWGSGLVADVSQGGIKFTNTLLGFGGFATGSEALARQAGEMSFAASLISEGSFDTGLTGAVIEELPSLFVQMALTRGMGAIGSGLKFSEPVVRGISTTTAILAAGAQSAGMTFSSQIAEGDSVAEARSKALTAGITTSLITGIFQKVGLGGAESAMVGKEAAKMTIRDLLKTVPRAELGVAVRSFAGDALKAYVGEAAEEGLDELAQAFLTADPDTNLADAWSNALEAAKIGGVIGSVADVGIGELDAWRGRVADAKRLIPSTSAELERLLASTQDAAAGLEPISTAAVEIHAQRRMEELRLKRDAVAPEGAEPAPAITAAESAELSFLEEQTADGFNHEAIANRYNFTTTSPQTATPAAEATPAASGEVFTFQVKGGPIQTRGSTGADLAEAVFGPAPEGKSYSSQLKPDEFQVDPKTGRVWHAGAPTSKVVDLKTGVVSTSLDGKSALEYPTGAGLLVAVKEEKETATVAEPAPAVAAAPEPAPEPAVPFADKSDQQLIEMASWEKTPGSLDESNAERFRDKQKAIKALKARGVEFSQGPPGPVAASGEAAAPAVEEPVMTSSEAAPGSTPDQETVSPATKSNDTQARLEADRKTLAELEPGTPAHAKVSARIAALEAELQSGPSLFASRASVADAAPRALVKATAEQAATSIQTDKQGALVVGNGSALGALRPGMVIATNVNGEVASIRVVTHTSVNEAGEVIHRLSDAYPGDQIENAEQYAALKPRLDEQAVRRVGQLARSLHGVDLSDETARVAAFQQINTVLRAALASVTSDAFADQALEFSDGGPSAMLNVRADGSARIQVNTRHWAERLRDATQSRTHQGWLVRAMAEDWLAEVEATMFHEAKHQVVVESLDRAKVVEAAKSLVAAAAESKNARGLLMAALRGRFANSELAADAALMRLSDEQLLQILQGHEVDGQKLESERLNDELWAIGVETITDFTQSLRSGMTQAQMRDAFDRFVDAMAGNPASEEGKSSLSGMIGRFVELANRAMEAMARFLRAHRMARTLPTAFVQLSLDADKLMQNRGFRTPDVTGVMERFSQTAIARMGQVNTVEKLIADRDWNDGTRVWTEYEVKTELRNILNRIADLQPRYRPVSVNPSTGRLEMATSIEDVATQDEVNFLKGALDFLNDPRRSWAAKQASDMARDMRLVLRNLNMGIPLTPGGRGQGMDPAFSEDIFFDENTFERVAPALQENLEVALERAAGFSPTQLLEWINNRRLQFAGDAIPPFVDHLRETLLTSPLGAYEPYAAVRREIDRLGGLAASLESSVESEPDPAAKRALLEQAGVLREQQLMQRYELEQVIERLANYRVRTDAMTLEEEALNNTMRLLRDDVRKARLQYERDLADLQRRQAEREASMRPFATIGDLADANLSRDTLAALFAERPVDADRLHSALESMRLARSAFNRVKALPEELEFTLVGGRPPAALRRERAARDEAWSPLAPLDLDSPDSLKLLPVGASRMLLSRSEEGGLGLMRGEDQSMQIMGPDGQPVEFATDGEFPDSDVAEMADRVHQASLAATRALGYDQSDRRSLDRLTRLAGVRRNAAAIGRELSRRFRNAMLWADPNATPAAVEGAGFAPTLSYTPDGTRRASYPSRLIELPGVEFDDSIKGVDATRKLFESGQAGQTLANALRFMASMEQNGSDALGRPTLWHSGGLTPAGAAYSLLAPKVLRFLALTKANGFKEFDTQQALLQSLDTESQSIVRRAYDGLLAGFERQEAFKRSRGDHYLVAQALWDMREAANASNAIYEAAMKEASLAARESEHDSKDGVTDDSRYPLDQRLLGSIEFETGYIRHQMRQLGGTQEGTAISLLSPVSAIESLQLLDSLEAERQKVRLVRGNVEQGGYSEEDARLMLEGGNRSENTDLSRPSDQMTNLQNEAALDYLRRQEELLIGRQERFLTVHLMALLGGNQTLVRQVVNSVASVDPATGELRWNREKLLDLVRARLTDMRRQEQERGVITSDNSAKGPGRNMVFDEKVREIADRAAALDRSGPVEGENPEDAPTSRFRAMFDQILWSGGTLRMMTESDFRPDLVEAADPEAEERARHQADEASVLFGLLRRIGNVSILTGKVNWAHAAGDDATRLPSVAFVPDPKHPLLLLPYGRMQATPEELLEATRGVLAWMSEHGGLDIAKAAEPILAQLERVTGEQAKFSIKAGYRRQYDRMLRERGYTVVSDEEFRILTGSDRKLAAAIDDGRGLNKERLMPASRYYAALDKWTAQTMQRLDQALIRMQENGGALFRPELLSSPKLNREKASIEAVAQLLSNPAMKEVLLLSTFEQHADNPTEVELGEWGDLVGAHNVRGITQIAYNDLLEALPAGIDIENSLGRGSRAQVAMGRMDPASIEALEQADELIEAERGRTDIPDPLAIRKGDMANANLYGLLRELYPRTDISEAITSDKKFSGLGEYEARQLLSIFGPDLMRQALEESATQAEAKWGSMEWLDSASQGEGEVLRGPTPEQLMNATGVAAQRLQRMFTAWANQGRVPGAPGSDKASAVALERFGNWSFTDPLRSGESHNPWEGNRIQKGALIVAELGGIEFEVIPGLDGQPGTARYASVVPDLDAFRAALQAKGILKQMPIGLDAEGNPLPDPKKPEMVDVIEAMRRAVKAERLRDREFIASEEKKARETIERHTALKNALEATRSLIWDYDYESLGALISWLEADPSNQASLTMASAFRDFLGSREEVALSLADDLLRNFESAADYINAFADPFSPRASSLVDATSPVAARLGELASNARAQLESGYLKARIEELDQRMRQGEGMGEQDQVLLDAARSHNAMVSRFVESAKETAPDLFRSQQARDYHIGAGLSPREASARLANFTNLLNRASSPTALREMAIRSVLRDAIPATLRTGSSIRGASLDRTLRDSRLELPAEAESQILQILGDNRATLGQRMSADDRTNAREAIGRVLFEHIYDPSELLDDARSIVASRIEQIGQGIDDNKLRRANDVLKALGALGRDGRHIGNPDSMARERAVAKVLEEALNGELSASTASIRARAFRIAESQVGSPRFAATRAKGYGSLLLRSGEVGGKTVASDDVEVMRRALEQYGRLWSRLYMDNYGKSPFQVGLSAADAAAEMADDLIAAGAGSLYRRSTGKGYRVSDGILEPEDARERVEAILRWRGSKVKPELVMARLKWEHELYARETRIVNNELLPVTEPRSRKALIKSLEERIVLTKEAIAKLAAETKAFQGSVRRKVQAADVNSGWLPADQSTRSVFIGADQPIGTSAVDNSVRIAELEDVLRSLEQNLAQQEAEREVLASEQTRPVSLFAAAKTASVEARAKAEADHILGRMNLDHANLTKGRIKAAAKSISARYEGHSLRDEGLANRRFMIEEAVKMLDARILMKQGIENPGGPDLHTALGKALAELRKNPNDADVLSGFWKVASKSLAARRAMDDGARMAAGYVHSDSPHETGWFFRSFKHMDAKIKAVFARDLGAVDIVNGIRSLLYRGFSGQGGKDRAKIVENTSGKVLEEALNKVDKRQRGKVANRGWMLAQIESHFLVARNVESAAKSLIQVFQAGQDGMARAIAQTDPSFISSGNALLDAAGWVPRQLRRIWRKAHERGFRLTGQRPEFLSMLGDVMPLLEHVTKTGDYQPMLAVLRSRWGPDAVNYADTLFAVFGENASGFADAALMRGANPDKINSRPVVPIVWSNQSHQAFSADRPKSVADVLSMDNALWMRNPHRTWDDAERYDLLDFDGISAPMRVLSDMAYRAMMAPSYDVVSAMIGDVSTASDHFSGFSTSDTGVINDGYVSSMAREQHDAKLINYQEMRKAQSAALAVSNMIRDEITNDFLGFSPASRAIELYRQISVIGLFRKLASLIQPIVQPLSPVIGYAATNRTKGLLFLPVLLKYNLASVLSKMGHASSRGFVNKMDRFIEQYAPTVAYRGANNIHQLAEMALDAKGRSSLNPITGLSRASGWALEVLIGKPEAQVIKPMLAHEVLWILNQGKPGSVSMEVMLDDPYKAGVTPAMLQNSTVKVQELFGPSDRSQKGKLMQPARGMGEEIMKSMLTTLAGHPLNMAATSDSAWRMMWHNKERPTSPEFREGLRLLGMTVTQNLAFVALSAPTFTYFLSKLLADDEDERREMEGRWYGIEPGETEAQRRQKLSYWVQIMFTRNEDPYGYAWHKGEWTDEQAAKHDGYRRARVAQEVVNQLPMLGSLTSTTLGGSLLSSGMKAAGISPDSAVKQAGIILPEKWGFTGTAADPDDDTPISERAVYQATKLWFNYLNDANSMAFAIDGLMQSAKMVTNNPNNTDAWDALMIGTTMLSLKPREFDRGAQRAFSMRERDEEFRALAPWKDR